MIRIGVLFAGGGLFAADLPADCHVAWAIECDSAIAAVHSVNHPSARTIADRAESVHYDVLPAIDMLQVSPECKEFSAAKSDGHEGISQLTQAEAICRALRTLRPRYFILENVRGYIRSDSLKMIGHVLHDLDYCVDQQVINSADYGVPQTRERLIIRARIGGFMGVLPPIAGRVTTWRGWYDSIVDLLPTLPDSHFAPWQIKRMGHLIDSGRIAFLARGDNTKQERGNGYRTEHEPSMTIRNGAAPRAFLLDGRLGKYGTHVSVIDESKPTTTVVASRSPFVDSRAQTRSGRVVGMTPRALARFQSVPDSFRLPVDRDLAIKIIGNGIPSRLGRLLVESLINE